MTSNYRIVEPVFVPGVGPILFGDGFRQVAERVWSIRRRSRDRTTPVVSPSGRRGTWRRLGGLSLSDMLAERAVEKVGKASQSIDLVGGGIHVVPEFLRHSPTRTPAPSSPDLAWKTTSKMQWRAFRAWVAPPLLMGNCEANPAVRHVPEIPSGRARYPLAQGRLLCGRASGIFAKVVSTNASAEEVRPADDVAAAARND